MKENITAAKSIDFAIKIIQLYKTLTEDKREYVMSKQLLRSGTAIGALVKEAEHAESKGDFLHKMNIALKEANELPTGFFFCSKAIIYQRLFLMSIMAAALN